LEIPSVLLDRLVDTQFRGTPNCLSHNHTLWPIIDEVSVATGYKGKMNDETEPLSVKANLANAWEPRSCGARRVIHQRRSAVALDGHTSIGRDQFYRMLARVSPSLSSFPHRVLPWRPRVSLALFVHRVDHLSPGIYLLIRHPNHESSLRAGLRNDFLWERPTACPEGLNLYLLEQGNAQEAAKVISCHQDIAADGAFSLGMLAHFDASLSQGPWFYPRLYWETGLIGQLLYLEAEAAGIRATGIGCFYDDLMHELLGIKGTTWQSLYHFTVGGAVDDPRLKTLHPYFHKGKK
jgi:nitroreductase